MPQLTTEEPFIMYKPVLFKLTLTRYYKFVVEAIRMSIISHTILSRVMDATSTRQQVVLMTRTALV